MKLIRVPEYGKIAISPKPKEGELSPEQAEQLFKVWDGLGSAKLGPRPRRFHQAIAFYGVCGLIGLDDVQIEIAPRIDEDPDVNLRVLIQMLQGCGDLRRVVPGSCRLMAFPQHPLVEMLFEMFCERVSVQMGRGLYETYESDDLVVSSPRGKLLMGRYLQQANPLRFPVRQQVRHADNLFNRGLRMCLERIHRRSQAPELQAKARQLMQALAEVGPEQVSAERVAQLKLGRAHARWQEVQTWMGWILADLVPMPSGGSDRCFTMLFQMNQVFQHFNHRLLGQVAAQWNLVLDQPRRSLLRTASGKTKIQLKPDHVLGDGERIWLIGDSKWKHLKKANPSHADLYQMYTYSEQFKSPHTALFYPKTEGLKLECFRFEEGGELHIVPLDLRLLCDGLPLFRTHLAEQLRPWLSGVKE